ncbi:kanadaptin [Anopheles nili]|uniref:kanadaptin n=1 Tax=Anopheles nili TaxID=185578 RepID=UPI00237A2456|nr:kanadaptin [Anopheles nili]
MTEEAEFKVPTFQPKAQRKSALPPALASKVNISLPTKEESANATQFEQNTAEIPPIPYKEPKWSGKCCSSHEYSFEVEKNGVIIEYIKELESKPFWLFGRLPNCDVNMAHPTISRYHAILQYRANVESESEPEEATRSTHVTVEPGWYLYDLNSTHGTFLNKQQIPSRTYVRVRVGYMIRLGSSSRTYILQGPSDDEDERSDLTITEMKAYVKKQKELRHEIDEITRKEAERIEQLKDDEGINWGMAEDADEETDLTENPYAASNNEELFLDDPKKTLRGYFEREGHELEYDLEELSSGMYCCKVELPIDDSNGRPILAEATLKGKKKDAVVQCALEACRILDRHGLLRQANHEPRRRFKKQSDSDDDDEFLDRTGDVEKRRQRKHSIKNPQTHTYADFIRKEAQILERLEIIEAKIQKSRLIKEETHLPENDDDVDKFLQNLSKTQSTDKFEVRKLRLEQKKLTEELNDVKKLIEMTKPIDLGIIGERKQLDAAGKRNMLPLFGKRNKLSNTFGIRQSSIKAEKDIDSASLEGKYSTDEPVDVEVPKESLKVRTYGSHATKVHHGAEDVSCSSTTARKRASLIVDDANDANSTPDDNGGASGSKKRRSRQRLRDNYRTRENVDFDDSVELEHVDKNVEWVPPSGQTGDGRTSLNEKFGY